MRKASLLALAAAAVALAAAPAPADTGTYRILEYHVKLTPRSDGAVEIEYRQRWLVTGGGIPWITVGAPGPDFTVLPARSGAVRGARREASGSWSGVRIDLDRNYTSGQTFDVGFTILQRGLLYADKENYRLDFTPGWYDRAETEDLQVEMFLFARADTVTAQPAPTRKEGQRFVWQFGRVPPGQKRSVSLSFPRNLFPANVAVAAKAPPSAAGPAMWDDTCVWFLVAGVFILIVVYLVIRTSVGRLTGYGRGGTIFFPGSSSGRGGRGGGIFSGGGGGFGGMSSSCACACAGCACACACAGGSAAGCDRKVNFTCPLCRQCAAACPLNRGARQ